MKELINSVILLSPLWTLSLLAFIPLTAKTLMNKELKQEVVSLIYGMAFFLSLSLLIVLGFNDKTVVSLKWDPYSSGACVLVNLSALICLVLFHLNSFVDKKQFTEILFFFSQSVVALYVFCLAQDFMTAFIGIEMSSLILYVNLAMSRKDLFSLEAAIKYFILSALSSVIFLYGMSFIFGATGILEWGQFTSGDKLFVYNRFFFLGFTLVFASLFFKIALFPFHFWLADVYQGALTPVTYFMSTGIKSCILLFLGKLLGLPFLTKTEFTSLFLIALAIGSILTVLFGNIMALKQKQLKRLFAFSSLSHSGYLMMALVGLLHEKNNSALFYYLLAYIFLTGGFLLVIQSLEKQSSQTTMNDISSLFYKNPFLAFSFSIFLLSLAGLPPTFGFFAKLAIFQVLISSANWWLLFWAFVGSAIGLFYYIKPITFMINPPRETKTLKIPLLTKFVLLILVFLSLFGAFLFGAYF